MALGQRGGRERLEPAGGALAAPLGADFERWLEASRARYLPPLNRRELHAGARALSALYVEGREPGRLARRATEGAGKRAAFASYFAPLHFLAVHHALRALPGALAGVRRILDLGCGTGAAGAAAARAAAEPPKLWAVDRSGWALSETRHTLAAFGLRGRLQRGPLATALPRAGAGDLLVLGWVVNELPDAERERLCEALDAALARGARLLLFEPLAGAAAPWWPDWSAALAPRGVHDAELRVRPALPPLLAEVDRATGLRHGELGARLLHGPTPALP